ncbi:MAG: tRNA pseudouridine(55) synthase TruB [Calothrix sp. MO_167.B42]|nr:tRNA pseudouridine(55) synthase TruB [Calothrix sp. MO_167.B42]
MQGFLNLDKPFGWTSHDCVAKTRKLLQIKRVGHAGTLDPAATGVLPIAVGRATRLLQYLPGDKAYKATIRLGVSTDTDDLQGEVIFQQPVTELTLTAVENALTQFTGKIEQVPPRYSAIQVQGKRLYDLARQGKTVEIPTRTVEIFNVEILDWRTGDFPELDIAIACGAGTYIRAIARDLGIKLNTGGTLAALQRTSSSGFHLASSINLTDLQIQLKTGNFQIIPPDFPLKHLSIVTLATISARKWCQGQRVPMDGDGNAGDEILRVYGEDGCFLGLGKQQISENSKLLVPVMVLAAI